MFLVLREEYSPIHESHPQYSPNALFRSWSPFFKAATTDWLQFATRVLFAISHRHFRSLLIGCYSIVRPIQLVFQEPIEPNRQLRTSGWLDSFWFCLYGASLSRLFLSFTVAFALSLHFQAFRRGAVLSNSASERGGGNLAPSHSIGLLSFLLHAVCSDSVRVPHALDEFIPFSYDFAAASDVRRWLLYSVPRTIDADRIDFDGSARDAVQSSLLRGVGGLQTAADAEGHL